MISKNRKNKSSKKETAFLIFLAVLFIGLITFAVVSNARITIKREQYNKRIKELQEQIKEMEQKKNELEKGVSHAETQEYLEEVARKNFGLKSPGEEVVVISKEKQEEAEAEKEEKKDENNIWDPKTWWEWISGKK